MARQPYRKRPARPTIKGSASAKTHQGVRSRYRKTLKAKGYPPELIDELVERKRLEQLAAREAYRAQQEHLAAPEPVDDSKHRPAKVDSVLTGQGRVTGATARSVKRRKGITRYEWDQLEGGDQ